MHCKGDGMSKMIRITDSTSKTLEKLVKMIGKSKQILLERAVEEFMREQFLKKTNKEYAEIKANPQLWAKELQEREEWDICLKDGLDDLSA